MSAPPLPPDEDDDSGADGKAMWGKLRTKVVVDHEAENPYDMSGESEEKGVLAQDVDKGIPCNDSCPGFELHVWKRVCKHCGTAAADRIRRKVEKVLDVQKLQFAEEVPENFDSTGFSYDYDEDGKITAESLAKAKAAAAAAAEDEYDGIDGIVKLPEPLKREFMVVTPHQPRAKRMMVTFIPKGAARTHQHRHCLKLDDGSGAGPAVLLLKVVVRIEKVPSTSGGPPSLGVEESGIGTYTLTPLDQESTGAVNVWFTTMQKDWEAPTEFAAVRKPTRTSGASALLKLKQSKRSAARAAGGGAPKAGAPPPAAPLQEEENEKSAPAITPRSASDADSNPGSYNVMFPTAPNRSYENFAPPQKASPIGGGDGGFGRLASTRPAGAPAIKALVVQDSMTTASMAHPQTVSRSDAEQLLDAERLKIGKGASGLFLLRHSAKKAGAVVLSIYSRNKMYHYNFTLNGSGQYVNNKGRVLGALPEVLRHYQQNNDGLPCVLGQFLAPDDNDDDDGDASF